MNDDANNVHDGYIFMYISNRNGIIRNVQNWAIFIKPVDFITIALCKSSKIF